MFVFLMDVALGQRGTQGEYDEKQYRVQGQGLSDHQNISSQARTNENFENGRGYKDNQVFITGNRKSTYFHSREEMIRLALVILVPILAFFISLSFMGCTEYLVPGWYSTGNSSGFYNFNSNKHTVNQS